MEDDEPNWILPEKRSSLKYSPLRSRIVFRSRAVHDLRVDFAWSADGDGGRRDALEVNAMTLWQAAKRASSSTSCDSLGIARRDIVAVIAVYYCLLWYCA